MINLDGSFVTAITDSVSSGIQQLWVVFAVFFSIVIVFFIIRKLIFLFSIVKR